MSHSQFQSKRFILRHAWLNLWDERMTTGRINQVAILRQNKMPQLNERVELGKFFLGVVFWCSSHWIVLASHEVMPDNPLFCCLIETTPVKVSESDRPRIINFRIGIVSWMMLFETCDQCARQYTARLHLKNCYLLAPSVCFIVLFSSAQQ